VHEITILLRRHCTREDLFPELQCGRVDLWVLTADQSVEL
jgi:hypothetical protein